MSATEEPKQKKKQMSKEYMRTYYHKHKTEIACPYCQKAYTCNSSLKKHQARSLRCAYYQIKSICDKIEDPDQRRNMEDSMKHMDKIINKTSICTTE